MEPFFSRTDDLDITAGNAEFLRVENRKTGAVCVLNPPVFEANGSDTGGKDLVYLGTVSDRKLNGGGREVGLKFGFAPGNGLFLLILLRSFPGSPFLRFRYELSAETPVYLTKTQGGDRIEYTGFTLASGRPELTEIQFSQFNPLVHSYNPNFEKKSGNELQEGCRFPGPVVLCGTGELSCLLAYEHGAEYPDTYLAFRAGYGEVCGAGPDSRRGSDGEVDLTNRYGLVGERLTNGGCGSNSLNVELVAEKGNYYDRQLIDKERNFQSPWFHFAICRGDSSDLLRHYRKFLLEHICESRESRKPYIYYNTWNFQERNNYIHGNRFLDSMNAGRMLEEIDTAYRMGIDVFVIDTGWYEKTGDWTVSRERFPEGLEEIRRKLDGYGMKLGLWFNPTVAAKSSEIVGRNPEYRATLDGKASSSEIWETEESYSMCLASGYSDYVIRKLVQLNRELGATYFKWDGISQYGCNSPHHNHGTEENSPVERQQCYSYRMGLEMIRIVEEVTRQCPGVIFDFDVTEGGRFVGLGFLSAGKYFLVNNGPYAMDFDLPEHFGAATDRLAVNLNPWTNVFFFPGPARSRFCRQGTKYDTFVPSILFLTHFLPDGPRLSQNNALASIVLGSNGIWGDLPGLGEEDINLFRRTLDKYKRVGEAAVAAYPVTRGFIGASPEIYEKIDPEKGQGIVCFFTKAKGTFTHITQPLTADGSVIADGADSFELLPDGKLKITVSLGEDDARTVFVLRQGCIKEG